MSSLASSVQPAAFFIHSLIIWQHYEPKNVDVDDKLDVFFKVSMDNLLNVE